ncbi:MAG TPA: cell wall-binding repeat-containing protein, partial [Coriobacteriia bacterium]
DTTYTVSVTPTATVDDPTALITATLNGSGYVPGTPVADGVWTLVVTAIDPAGNTDSETLHFVVDTSAPGPIPPDLTILGVSDDTTYTVSVTPDATSTDPAASLEATLNGAPFVLGTTITADGTYTLVVAAVDPSRGTTTSTVRFVVSTAALDTTPPGLVVTGVSDGGSYAATVSPHATTSDPAALITATLNGSPYTLGTPLGDGTYVLVVTARDPAGNTTVRTVHFAVALPKPPTAPDAPIGLDATGRTYAIALDWQDSADPSVTGYHVYRATAAAGPFARITASPVAASDYLDLTVDISREYFYQVTAIGTGATESARSNTDSATAFANLLRHSGPDRYVVALNTSNHAFRSSKTVLIATGRTFPDALTASSLAGYYHAPLLLVSGTRLPSGVIAEIRRLGAINAVILGGTGSVPESVAKHLRSLGLTVQRIGGPDRFVVAHGIASDLKAKQGAAFSKTFYLVRSDLYTDGLSVSPLAYQTRSPILLTRPSRISGDTLGLIRKLGFTDCVIIGGNSSVSPAVEKAVRDMGLSVTRVGGRDRFETSYNVGQYAYVKGIAKSQVVWTATGFNFPDALTGGVAVGERGGIIMLTTPTAMHPLLGGLLADNRLTITEFAISGGPASVSGVVGDQARAILLTPTP